MLEVPKGTPMPDKQQALLYHKGENWQICRFNGFVFVEPLVLLKGESKVELMNTLYFLSAICLSIDPMREPPC